MTNPQRVGFIGLGLMGKPMAHNILKAGFPLTVHNRSRAKVDELANAGATPAEGPAEVARNSDVIITCLPGPADVRSIYLDDDGVLAESEPGSVLIEMSTVDVETHKDIAAAAGERGVDYLDAPISGGTAGAESGTLSIMIGGDAQVLERVRPVLDAMGENIYHCGPLGAGAVVKLANNLMVAINAQGVYEGMVLGVKAGVDPAILYEVVANSSGSSQILKAHVPSILERDFDPGFAIDLMLKDVRLAMDLGDSVGVRMLSTSLAAQSLQEARDAGLGQLSTQAQVQVLEKLAGITIGGGDSERDTGA